MNEQTVNQASEQSTALDAVITESGLQLTEAEAIKQSYLPYFEQLNDIKEQATKINFEQPTDVDETIARELRLKLVKIRTGSEDVKKERKQIHMLKGNLEQSAWNLIRDTCLLDEEKFSAVEKRREIEEKQRKENLCIERETAVEPYGADVEHIALGEMSEEVWENYFNGVKASYEQKVAAEQKAEEDRIAKEQAAADERARIQEENQRLQKEAEAKEKAMQEEREKTEAERKALEEKLRLEAEAKEKELADAREKAKAEQKALEEKARQEAEEVERKAEEERQRVEAERETERKAAEEAARKEAEEKAKIEAELQAAKDAKAAAETKREAIVQAELSKGDKEKFQTILVDLGNLKDKYEFQSDEYKEKQSGINDLIDKIIAYYQDNQSN